jgi:hypothetical protein
MRAEKVTHAIETSSPSDPEYGQGTRTIRAVITETGSTIFTIKSESPDGTKHTNTFALSASGVDDLFDLLLEIRTHKPQYEFKGDMQMVVSDGGASLETLEDLPGYGDLFTEAEFRESNEHGAIVSYDGSGYWATEKHMSHQRPVFGRGGRITEKPHWATHVMWFNK